MIALSLVASIPSLLVMVPPMQGPQIDQSPREGGSASTSGRGTGADAAWVQREAELIAEIERLKDTLRQEQATAVRRTQEWIEYVRLLRGFEVKSLPEPPEFMAEALEEPPDQAVLAEARRVALALARGSAIRDNLRAILIADGVRTVDILEVGSPHSSPDGRPAVGPVVARVMDDRGRLTGMFKAEHMMLEVSRAARTVTLILEDGYETRSGRRQSFDGVPIDTRARGDVLAAQNAAIRAGTRRIVLADIETRSWVEAFPDLIDGADRELFMDDGVWDTDEVRTALVGLLAKATDPAARRWKLVGLGGVAGDELRDVQLAELGPIDRRIERRLFADRVKIHVRRNGVGGARSVELELLEGSVKRTTADGHRMAPFLEGRFRIALPAADPDAWLSAPIPRAGEAAPLFRPDPGSRSQPAESSGAAVEPPKR